jgi:hypothetical protein
VVVDHSMRSIYLLQIFLKSEVLELEKKGGGVVGGGL